MSSARGSIRRPTSDVRRRSASPTAPASFPHVHPLSLQHAALRPSDDAQGWALRIVHQLTLGEWSAGLAPERDRRWRWLADRGEEVADAVDAGVPVGALVRISPDIRLALEMAANEMAANEEPERRAMDGELAALETAWREAEEIAAIADDLLLPANVGESLRRHGPAAARRVESPER